MFGFNKKKEQKPKTKHTGIDKILMGMILGGAIGSVIGIGLAPKKGSETRKLISKKANQLFNDAKDAVSEVAEKITDKAHHLVDPTPEVQKTEKIPLEKPKGIVSAREKVKSFPEE